MTIVKLSNFKSNTTELLEWKQRLRLAYERDWSLEARNLCVSEINRLEKLTKPATIRDKIAEYSK